MNANIVNIQTKKFLVAGFSKLLACIGLVAFNFTNKASADGPWDAYAQYSSIQGANSWYYQQRPRGGGAITNMTFPAGDIVYRTTDAGNTGWLGNYQNIATGHPGNSIDVIRNWVAPSGGTVSITGRVYKVNTSGGAGVVASVEKNGTQIWSKTVGYNDAVGYTTDVALGAISVNSGDSLAFIIDDNGTYAADQFAWDPVITKIASYDALAQLTSTQGSNGWYYQQRPQGGGTVTNMTYTDLQWRTTDYPGGNSGWLGYYLGTDGHPGASLDVIRKWVAPSAGTISVKGRVYKTDTGGGAGIIASVEHNGTSIWSRTVAYNDSTGYSTDAALSGISVSANDTMAFIVDDNSVFGYDSFAWDPVITFNSSTSPAWRLNTTDTLMTLTITGNRPTITNLEDASSLYNWTPNPVTVPLLNTVYEGSTSYNPNWTYTTASVDTSSGTKVTLTFASTTPSLALTQVWWARPGGGPVEETSSITNNTGTAVTYQNIDLVPADLTVTSDAAVTLWRFYRINYGDVGGTATTAMSAGTSVASTASNDYNSDSDSNGVYVLPFIMLDVPGAAQRHGLYMGYSSDFANFNVSASSSNADQIESTFHLLNTGSITDGSGTSIGTVLPLPGMFFGTYTGDTDTGSNKMKSWFWTNKMTPSLKSTTNEPMLSLSLAGNGFDADSQADANHLFSTYSLTSLGYEMCKEDYLWTDDANNPSHQPFGWDWNPNTTSWPNGMTLGSIAHNNGVKLSLYMANRYNLVALSTAAGVTSEQTALQTRFNGTAPNFVAPGFDFWRTDIDFEGVDDYLSHVGFMKVVDYLISNNSGFRWENCSSGGSKKSFDLLQRLSYINTVDDPTPTTHYRQAYYGNSYMINPVQMQFTSYENSGAAGATAYQHRNGFLGSWLLGLPDTPSTGEASLYKNTQRPILRGADVYHILPVADGTHWDGFEFINTSRTSNPKGSVVLFKPNSSTTTSGTFYLKGLIPTATYSLSYQDRTGSNASMTGSALMAGGTGLSISGTANVYDSEIIWLNW